MISVFTEQKLGLASPNISKALEDVRHNGFLVGTMPSVDYWSVERASMPASGTKMRAKPKVARFGIDVEKPILPFASQITTG